MSLNDTIPWTKPIEFSKTNRTNTLILARRKSFALRCLPIYLPNTLVGSLYYYRNAKDNSQLQSIPLIASNIHTSWIEVNYRFGFTYHVPLLTTPGIDSKRYQFGMFDANKYKDKNNWDEYISMTESYDYSYDSRITIRKAIDRTFTQINLLIESSKLINRKLKLNEISENSAKMFWKLVMLSKVMTQETFDMILVKIDKCLQY